MTFKWTSSNKYLIKFLLSLFIIGIIVGVFLYIKQPSLIKSSIMSELGTFDEVLKTTRQSNFIYHLIILCVFTILSLLVIGIPVILFYFFYEGVSIGFLIAGFFSYKKIEGLLYGVIFIIVNKLLIYISLIYLLIVSINFAKKMIMSLKNKDYKIYEHIFNHLIKYSIILLIIMIYDTFLYFFGNKILSYFLFLF